jgi:AcrR family transcriptional regulator
MSPTLRETLLQEAVELFQTRGISALSPEDITRALDISPATYREMFHDKNDLVVQVVQFDIERQRREHAELFARVSNPVQRLFSLLEIGIRDLQKIKSPAYVPDMARDFPDAWGIAMEHLEHYSQPQVHNLLNDGVLQKLIRGDINIALVSKIILAMFNLILNEQIFPPSRYNLAEVYRSVYLYYIRGLCTDEGIKAAASHFARV